jgi:hypothetical protein
MTDTGSSSSDSEYDYSEPWSMFAGEEQPWKNLNRLLKWDEKMDTQKEMGDAFGCSPSTISYWLQKAKSDPNVHLEDGSGIQCERCDGETPGHNVICNDCLDGVRDRDAGAEYNNYKAHLDEVHE